ncbi:hypothetical protein PI124_g4040 [Phytophthora idaei]|nr:hypothetical protein PI125_g4325 [Phytophthora idaei]KAG3166678.1 hypothetical protein PI126_g4125 [Phytophthora idaei]KAG3251369.1 hypothetical protein PI124_g4040 [Phytophthora idaei]
MLNPLLPVRESDRTVRYCRCPLIPLLCPRVPLRCPLVSSSAGTAYCPSRCPLARCLLVLLSAGVADRRSRCLAGVREPLSGVRCPRRQGDL